MPARRWTLHLSAAVLMVLAVACRDAPLAPSLSRAGATPLFSRGGNSDAAHACQQGGYQNLFRTDGTGFTNVGDCVSYAAQGGTLATRRTATFTNVSFSACNQLTWGYTLDGVANDFETFAGGCLTQPGSDQTVSFLSTQTLLVFLRDDTCEFTFFEDGNHALVTGTNPKLIEISDAGGFCEAPPSVSRPPVGRGNLDVTETIS